MNTIDASLFAAMFLAGAKRLEQKKEWINELNVFPVPDGDTGTNMTMTIVSAVKEINALGDVKNMAALAKAVSSGSLRGARGNSGVILSQLLRGFCKGIREHEQIDTYIICSAFSKATETAYKAVMKPKAGTILTVARGFSEEASRLLEEDPAIEMEALLEGSLTRAKEVLARTPDMLPVLKEAGVVDSGGQGLIQILSGAFDRFLGKETAGEEEAEETRQPVTPVYCVECIVSTQASVDEKTEFSCREQLRALGEDVVTAPQGQGLRMHVHTEDPGHVLSEVIAWGILSKVRVQLVQDGHAESIITRSDRARMKEQERAGDKKADHTQVAFISVCAGEGLGNIFKDLGVTRLIEGGQTMNPSTEDLLNAIEEVNADTVFVFPNNKNIILAATQAASLAKDTHVVVVPSKTIPQGIAAMIGYNPQLSVQENEAQMFEDIQHVQTCQLTYAVRDTHIDDKHIHEGDIMGVGDKGILAVGKDLPGTAIASIEEMVTDESELISIYYGEDIKEEDANAFSKLVADHFPQCEVEINPGGQPVYYYVISVE